MIEHKNEVLIDFLDIEGMKIIQRNDYFNFSLDSVLLANFVRINRNTKNILDLGTGNASIPLLLSKRTSAFIKGIEIQEVSANLAKRNIEINKLEEKIEIIQGDLKDYNKFFKEKTLDLVLSNPPFFKLDGNIDQINDLDQLSYARHEIKVNLEDIIRVSSILLKNRAYFAMVHRADRLSEILETMKKYRIEPKRLQFCYSKSNKNSKILLIEGMKDSASNLQIMPPIFTHSEDGQYSDVIKRMFRGEY